MTKDSLRIRNLTVSFNGFLAINNVDLDVDDGELRVIIGPNGAGKSTLMDLITGKSVPTKGTIMYKDKSLIGKSIPIIASQYSVARKFQNPNVFDHLSVYENLMIALKSKKSVTSCITYGFSKKNSLHEKEVLDEVLEQVNLAGERNRLACFLSHGQRQWLEIGMVLAQQAELLIFDEPTAGMTEDETYKTGELIKSLAGTHTILAVEHDMTFVRQIAKKVTVLNQGSVLAEGSYEEIEKDPRVIQVYLKEDYDE